MVFDSLEAHLTEAGSIERAAVPIGMYLAWCANLHLLSREFQENHESALLRLRYRELSPAEFLTATGDGSLNEQDLNEDGRSFTRGYYPDYRADFESTFSGDVYAVKDDWAHYDRIAAVLTRRYMSERDEAAPEGRLRRKKAGGRKWWQVWR